MWLLIHAGIKFKVISKTMLHFLFRTTGDLNSLESRMKFQARYHHCLNLRLSLNAIDFSDIEFLSLYSSKKGFKCRWWSNPTSIVALKSATRGNTSAAISIFSTWTVRSFILREVITCSLRVPQVVMNKRIEGNKKIIHKAEVSPPFHDKPLTTRDSFTLHSF